MLIDCPCCKEQLNLEIVNGRPVLTHGGNHVIEILKTELTDTKSDTVKLFERLGAGPEASGTPNAVIAQLRNLK